MTALVFSLWRRVTWWLWLRTGSRLGGWHAAFMRGTFSTSASGARDWRRYYRLLEKGGVKFHVTERDVADYGQQGVDVANLWLDVAPSREGPGV